MKFIDSRRRKIILSLILSFLVVKILSASIFFAGTPRINPFFIARLKALPGEIRTLPNRALTFLTKPFAQFSNFSNKRIAEKALEDLPKADIKIGMTLTRVSKGVYAVYDEQKNLNYLKIIGGTKIEVRVYKIKKPDGTEKEVKIFVPLSE